LGQNTISFWNYFSFWVILIIIKFDFFALFTKLLFHLIFSGVFIALDFFGKKPKKISLASYIKFVIEKWIRFNIRCIGPILVLIWFSALGDGPVWHLGDQYFVNSCKTNYWQNLLFLNTYTNGIVNVVRKQKIHKKKSLLNIYLYK
jgi:hypothetical protein